jgi:hypothetical protein
VNFGLTPHDPGSGDPIPAKGYRVVGLNPRPERGALALDLRR